MLKKILSKPLIIILFLALPAVWPIVKPGYFPIHDNTQVVRIQQMTQSLLDGHFPVRWTKDLGYGYGYPIFNFYNPLPYYFGSLFALLGFSFLTAAKIMFIFPILFSAITMYVLIRKYFGQIAALVSSIFYVYAPYHAVQVFVRGSVAEYWAYALVPLVIYFLLQKKVFSASISIAVLVLSHNLTSLMLIAPILILFILNLLHQKHKILTVKNYLFSGLLGICLSAFFWLPAMLEKQFTSVDQMVSNLFNPLNHFVFARQLWDMPWGFGGSAPASADGISFIIGKSHLILTLISAFIIFTKWKKIRQKNQKILLSFSLLILVFALFMLSPYSNLLWKNLTFLKYLQFPWRYLSLIALSTSILTGFLIKNLPRKLNRLIYILLIVFIFLSSKLYFQPQFKFANDVNSQSLTDSIRIKLEVSGRSDEYRPQGAITPIYPQDLPSNRFQINLTDDESVQTVADKTHLIALKTHLNSSKKLTFNIYSFPGWQASVNNQITPIKTDSNSLITILVPAGDQLVNLRLKDSPIRKTANIISLGSIVIILFVNLKRRYNLKVN